MGMIYLGNQTYDKPDGTSYKTPTYIDSDDLSDEDYYNFCIHRDNLRKFYKLKDNENAITKANMLGINIQKLIEDAEDFVAVNLLYNESNWRKMFDSNSWHYNSYRNEREKIESAIEAIAYDLEA
jgi:hypothetical protein